MILFTLLNSLLLQTIPGGKLVTDGLSDIANSDSRLMNKLLIALLILICLLFFCVVKYLIKKHKDDLILQNEKNKEENAINSGNQQSVIKGKDEVIATLKTENEYLKQKDEKHAEDKNMILRDNIEALKQLGIKIGQNTDVSVNILGTLAQQHENMKVFVLTTVNNTK